MSRKKKNKKKTQRKNRASDAPKVRGGFLIGRAALDSTATNARVADYYRDAINESAAETFDASTREIAQARGQHEFLNDPLFYGACTKIAALTCGRGPALKIEGPYLPYGARREKDDEIKAQYLERLWGRFADAIDILNACRLLETELLFHGEAFIRKVPSNKTIDGFDYAFIRPERINDPPGVSFQDNVNDGIVYDCADDSAEPVAYYVQKEYVNPWRARLEYELVPAGEILHIFNRILPQQRRGIPEVQSALGLIRELKVIRRLEIQAVKNAAKTAVILHSDAPQILDAAMVPNEEGEVPLPKSGSHSGFELPDGIFIAPPGYDPTFGDSKHPAAGYDSFKKILAADVGASLGIGSGKANNDHSAYNFSSAKMDEQVDATVVSVRQEKIANGFLNVVFNDWLTELSEWDDVAAEFLDRSGGPENVERRWLFPAPRSIDRLKDAQADELELRLGTITRAQILARRGLDAEEVAKEQLREMKQQAEMRAAAGIEEQARTEGGKDGGKETADDSV